MATCVLAANSSLRTDPGKRCGEYGDAMRDVEASPWRAKRPCWGPTMATQLPQQELNTPCVAANAVGLLCSSDGRMAVAPQSVLDMMRGMGMSMVNGQAVIQTSVRVRVLEYVVSCLVRRGECSALEDIADNVELIWACEVSTDSTCAHRMLLLLSLCTRIIVWLVCLPFYCLQGLLEQGSGDRNFHPIARIPVHLLTQIVRVFPLSLFCALSPSFSLLSFVCLACFVPPAFPVPTPSFQRQMTMPIRTCVRVSADFLCSHQFFLSTAILFTSPVLNSLSESKSARSSLSGRHANPGNLSPIL